MLGILLGTACLVALVKVARMGHHGRWGGGFGYGCGHGHGHGRGCGGRGGDDDVDGPRHGGWGPRIFLRGLFRRLDTTPGQEKAIKAALEEVVATARQERREWRDLTELAVLLTGESFDATAAEGLSGKADASFAKVRVATVEALRKVHEALDDGQRKVLSDWLRARGGAS